LRKELDEMWSWIEGLDLYWGIKKWIASEVEDGK
jgi:hypothetical protein